MSRESYIRGFCKAAEAAGVDPRALAKFTKSASWGDIVNAGYGAMCMGSPCAPRLFSPGTNNLKPSKEIQRENRNTAIGGAAGLAAGLSAVYGAPAAWSGLSGAARFVPNANRWVFTKMMGPTVGPRVAKWAPWVSGGSFAARTADGALGLTHIEPSDSAAMQGVKRLTRDYILPAGQLLNPAGAGAYVLGNGMADAAFRPAIRETTASLIKPEDVEKFMEDLSQSNPQGWAGLMLGGLSMAGDRFDKKVKSLALPSKVVYNQLRRLYPQLPEDADMEGIREGYDKAIRDFRANIANSLEKSDSTIGKSVGKMFNSNPGYFNDLLDRLSSGDYSKSITSRLGADPFFGTSAAWEGVQDSTKKFLLDYASKKLNENPEAVAALGLGLSNVGRKVYAGGKAINDRIEEHNQKVKQEMLNGQAKPNPSQVGAPVKE